MGLREAAEASAHDFLIGLHERRRGPGVGGKSRNAEALRRLRQPDLPSVRPIEDILRSRRRATRISRLDRRPGVDSQANDIEAGPTVPSKQQIENLRPGLRIQLPQRLRLAKRRGKAEAIHAIQAGGEVN